MPQIDFDNLTPRQRALIAQLGLRGTRQHIEEQVIRLLSGDLPERRPAFIPGVSRRDDVAQALLQPALGRQPVTNAAATAPSGFDFTAVDRMLPGGQLPVAEPSGVAIAFGEFLANDTTLRPPLEQQQAAGGQRDRAEQARQALLKAGFPISTTSDVPLRLGDQAVFDNVMTAVSKAQQGMIGPKGLETAVLGQLFGDG